jgi:geranylgeranyl pyrophosphate synthase
MPDIAFPDRFDGLFGQRALKYAPLLRQARKELAEWPVPRGFEEQYASILSLKQPSFMLLPLMYLYVAEATGEIRESHRSFLPVTMLAMEAAAVADDTVDGSATRSGEPTFPARWGVPSSAPCMALLTSMIAQKTARSFATLVEPTMALISNLAAAELQELRERYPCRADFDAAMQTRYRQAHEGVLFGFRAALLLAGHTEVPTQGAELLGRITQDVDDLINLLERREEQGEGNDLKNGTVTAALIEAVDRNPDLANDIEQVWRPRESHNADPGDPTFPRILHCVVELGAPAVRRRLDTLSVACAGATPTPMRPLMRQLAADFVARADQCQILGSVPKLDSMPNLSDGSGDLSETEIARGRRQDPLLLPD